MIFGVDGTGAFWDRTYNAEMRNSFVKQICDLPGGKWWRGPDAVDTFLSGPNPRVVAEYIRMAVVPNAAPPKLVGTMHPIVVYPRSDAILTDLKEKVFLTGYSRGAATMLDVAVLLEEYGLPVEAMFLFDSVTRSPWLSASVIPANVKKCYHARRSPKAKSRPSFGNSEAKPQKKGALESFEFFTTHAGMGGTPWGPGGVVEPASPSLKMSFEYGETVLMPRELASIMVADEPAKYKDKIFEGAPDWKFTEVTVQEEARGMRLVEEWMWSKLAVHGLAKPRPYRGI